ncbi:MAG TPA: acetylxylan esterase [Micromonosporaceae bacterium]|jgi:cephalosporin-C deacetylase
MVLFDMPREELERYVPEVAEPADFVEFWRGQLADAGSHPLAATFTPVATPLRHADVFDVSFAGYGGDPIKGWLHVPHRLAPNPALVVEFIGYGGGRGLPIEWLSFSAAGHLFFVMDSRGQGGNWRTADTPDAHEGGLPGAGGFLTRGVLDPARMYYTRLYIDAARAIAAARAYPGSAGVPVVATGASQGGALSLAAAHLCELAGDGVVATMPDVPFLSHFARAIRITGSAPYSEIIQFCKAYPHETERVFANLSYLDVVNHARRSAVPALFSVGLVDDITPASTVYAAYNHYAGPKQIRVYPFNGHEGGGAWQVAAKLEFLSSLLSAPAPAPRSATG